MSRGTFRVALDTPRPTAAVALVGLASLTLTLTGQLELWAVGLQGAALLTAVALRERPVALQRNPLVLNLGLGAIVAASLAVALRGGGALVALAHFATLSQGLQLLDARPRRSEFLLVALALFQVILASNLTDSVLFPPLLALFLPTAVWTLLVHTLRTEAQEAGDPTAASRALTPGLMGVTLAASAASIVVALLLFMILPRMHAGLASGRFLGAPTALAGFSDRMDLGDFGRIRGDPSVVMRVETIGGSAPDETQRYWRGVAFDVFDGRSWSLSKEGRRPIAVDAELGVDLARSTSRVNLTQRILREPVTAGVLFGVGEPVRIQGSVGRLERDENGALFAPTRADDRVSYTLASRWRARDEEALRADHVVPPRDGEHWLALPGLGAELRVLALNAAGPGETDAERVKALETWLREHGHYSDTPPYADPQDPRSPIERFLLGERTGHCEYFASAMVVLARTLGLPARVVNGFAGGRENRIGGFVEVTRSDAHAWVEVHYARAGWVRYDPTPPDLRLRGEAGLSLGERLYELQGALELWWFQHVVEFDRVDQLKAMQSAWRAWRALREPGRPSTAPGDDAEAGRLLARYRGPVLGLLGVAGLGVVAVFAWRRGAHARRDRVGVPPAYSTALRLLARRGLVRAPETTARDFARHAGATLPRPAAEAFEALTVCYLAVRFGSAKPTGAGAFELRALRDSLRG